MGRPRAPVPEFDDQRPWGAYPPSAGVAAALAVSHRLPPALSALTKLLRRPVKYGWATPLDLEVWGLKLRLLPRGMKGRHLGLAGVHSGRAERIAVTSARPFHGHADGELLGEDVVEATLELLPGLLPTIC